MYYWQYCSCHNKKSYFFFLNFHLRLLSIKQSMAPPDSRMRSYLLNFDFYVDFFSKMWKYWNHNFFVNLEYAWLPWCNDFWALLREEAFRSRYYYEIVVKSRKKLWLKLAKTPINIWPKPCLKSKKGPKHFFQLGFYEEIDLT